MIGVPEREEARVIPIAAHPKFRDHTIPEIVIEGDEGYSETYEDPDGVDEAMMEILEETVGSVLEEKNAIGNNVCYLCTHQVDIRPWWKKIFSAPDEASFLCGATTRTEVINPVSGQIGYIERVHGGILAMRDKPHRYCAEVNPDGRCQVFSIQMSKKKKH
jgi:hypothetical protein